LNINARLHDLREADAEQLQALDPDSYAFSQSLAAQLRAASSEGRIFR
jgi:hypothetical protein